MLSAAWLGLAVVAAVAAWWPKIRAPSDDRLRLWQLDVGQGESALLKTPSGAAILIDGGGGAWPGARDPGRWVVAPALRALGIKALDLVIVTHPHPDHIGGLAHVLAQWPVRTVAINDDLANSPKLLAALGAGKRGAGHFDATTAHYTFGEVALSLLRPFAHGAASQNDRSIVTQLRYRQQKWLFTGDIERRAEALLLPELAAFAPIALLQVPHHGSQTSSHPALLQLLRPQWALIACGTDNRFGFPHRPVLAGLARVGAKVVTTAAAGTLAVTTDGHRLEIRCDNDQPCTGVGP